VKTRFLFTGREWLSDLRVYDYRHRHYQPELGRFLQPDPKHFAAGDYNIYRYCHNDPVNKSDPMGLLEFEFGKDNALQRDFNTARQYLSQDAGMRAGFNAVEKSSFRVVVERSSGFNQAGRVEGKDTIVIKWDPRMGVFFPTTRDTQSPAMGLGHEVAGHAQQAIKDPELKQGIHEEMRVINNIETPAAKALGEGVRVKYEGRPIKVKDVLDRKVPRK